MQLLKNRTQPWIGSRLVDWLFILLPPFLSLFAVMLFPAEFKNSGLMPVECWVILIVMIDVAHVYSTLYRTYFNPDIFRKQHPLLIAIPLLCYAGGVLLYCIDGLFFWRALAYLAVFHFVRQQYGFMRLYSRTEEQNLLSKYIDTAAVYAATLYPLIYWHFNGGHKNFNWFVEGDFALAQSDAILHISKIIYLIILAAYFIKTLWVSMQKRQFNIPKNVLIAGTFLTWYFGIVYFNGDMAFTTLNVISHGIPYMALIWILERKRYQTRAQKKTALLKLTFNTYGGVFCFIVLLILFAYFEEGLWDGLVWKDHPGVFKPFGLLPVIKQNVLLALIVPLLALPQSTHYVLDGFIWRRKSNFSNT